MNLSRNHIALLSNLLFLAGVNLAVGCVDSASMDDSDDSDELAQPGGEDDEADDESASADDGSASADLDPAGAAPSDSDDPGIAIEVGKPAPVRPAIPPGVALGEDLPAKPAHPSMSEAGFALTGWTVALSANPSSVWPTQYTTLTATANGDVGPTPYYMRIRDTSTGAFIASCGAGTTCSVPVTQPLSTFKGYIAYIENSSGNDVQASSPVQFVEWYYAGLTLSASPTTVAVGGSTTLTATTAHDVGPSPFYTEIFDVTTGTLLRSCGFGTSCSVQVSQAAASTHTFRAYVSPYSASLPPPGLQDISPVNYVTWTNTGLSIQLGAPVVSGLTETVTATASINVGPTPYYIEIFNNSGARLAVCGVGSTCTAQFPAAPYSEQLVAFISDFSPTLPPSGVQASSNVVNSVVVIP